MRRIKLKMMDAVEIKFISFKDSEFSSYTANGEIVYEALKEYFENHFECESETVITKKKKR